MGIIQLLSRINIFRKSLREHYSIDKAKRDKIGHEQAQVLINSYKSSLQDIKLGKIRNDYQFNLEKINDAAKNKLIKGNILDNLIYNNDLSKLRDIHPVLYIVINNKVYYLVETTSPKIVKKPVVDELDIDNFTKEYITVQYISNNLYISNAIYVIEAKDNQDLANIIEDVEQNIKLKNKFLGNKDELTILTEKEKAFEIFYKKFLNQEPEILIDKDTLIEEPLSNNLIVNIDVTFDKYIKDNVDRISNYDMYKNESLMGYLKLYEAEEVNVNKNDPSDI